MSIEQARKDVIKAEKKLDIAQKAYLKELAADDEITRVAFVLFQMEVAREEDWEGPVTWDHWHELQIDSERDEYRKLAAEVIAIVREYV